MSRDRATSVFRKRVFILCTVTLFCPSTVRWRRAMKLSFERFEIPIIAPCGDLAVAQLKYTHTRHADAFVSNLEMIHAFGHHDIIVGYDVTYVPRQSRHSPGADAQGLSNSGAALNGWPGPIPPNSVLAKIAHKLIQVSSHADLHKLTDQDYALGIFQPEPPSLPRNDLPRNDLPRNDLCEGKIALKP